MYGQVLTVDDVIAFTDALDPTVAAAVFGDLAKIDFVRDILRETDAELVMCGLVSHNYLPENVHDDRETLCERERFDRGRFVLIPKALADDDLEGFVSLVKLALVAKPIEELRERATDV